VRGPAADIADNRFSEIPLPNGGFRGFDAHGDTRVIDGRFPWDVGGPQRTVLTPDKAGTYDSCGQWIQHVEPVGGGVLGFKATFHTVSGAARAESVQNMVVHNLYRTPLRVPALAETQRGINGSSLLDDDRRVDRL
jgi:hypothetical protein